VLRFLGVVYTEIIGPESTMPQRKLPKMTVFVSQLIEVGKVRGMLDDVYLLINV
jgi:hypothetical protein